MDAPKNGEPRTGLSMGDHQAITALEWGITREAQDELAATSHQNLARAWEQDWMDDLVTPFRGVEGDSHLRPDSTVEKLAKLKPAYDKGAAPQTTPANPTPHSAGDPAARRAA